MIAGTPFGRAALVCGVSALALMAGCSSTPTSPSTSPRAGKAGSSSGGGYYLDDGPGSGAPTDLAAIPDARPRREPIVSATTRPYVVFGRTYTPRGELASYREQGVASWYGRKFHGQKTSSGEVYDMYGMTAAHPTLPIPSYVRVTSLSNGNSVIVRVNDRGPFLNNRLIDLSWTAAAKLGYVNAGHARVEVEQITRFDGDDGMPVRVPDNVASAGGPANAGNVTNDGGGAAMLAPPAGASMAGAPSSGTPASNAPTLASASSGAPGMPGATGDAPTPAASSLAIEAIVAASTDVVIAGHVAGASAPGDSATPRRSGMTTVSAMTGESRSGSGAGPLPIAEGASAQVQAARAAQAAAAEMAAGHYVQLAAYSSRDGAEAGRAKLAREAGWIVSQVHVRLDGGLYKLRAGPYPEREQARQTAERLRQTTELKPIMMTR